MGFQDMVEVVHRAASSKGGKIRGRKGLAAMSPEKRREIQSKGGKARHGDNDRKATKQAQGSGRRGPSVLETILGGVDGDNDIRANAEPKKQ